MSARNSSWFALTSFSLGCGIAIASFGVGLLVFGFFGKSGNEPSSASGEPAELDSNVTNDQLYAVETSNTENPDVSLSELLDISSDFDRSVALDRLLSTSSASELLDLINQAIEITSPNHRQRTLTEIFQRFSLIDPTRALTQTKAFPRSLRDHLASVVYQEWSLVQLDKVIEYVKQMEHDEKVIGFTAIFSARSDLSEAEKQKVATQLGLEQQLVELIERNDQNALQADPNKAWTELTDSVNTNPIIDDNRAYELADIARLVIEREGIEAIDRLSNSITHRWTRNAVVSNVLSQIAYTDPKSAFEQATKMLNDSNRYLAFSIINTWKYQDRAAALIAVADLPPNDLRNDLQRDLILDWARSDPIATLEAVANWPQSDFRDELTGEVVVLWARQNPHRALEQLSSLSESVRPVAKQAAIRALAYSDPKAGIRYLEEVPEGREREQFVFNALFTWAQMDTVQAIEWTLNDPLAESYRKELMSLLPINVTDENVDLLMKMALDHPLDESGEGFERHIVARLAFVDVEKAKALLPRVREGRTRLLAQVAIGFSSIFSRNDPSESIAYSDHVADNQKSEYLGLILGGWAMRQPKQAYDYIEQLPSTEAQARAAMWLIAYNTYNRKVTYSEDQIEHLSSYLTEKELKELEDDQLWQKTMGN